MTDLPIPTDLLKDVGPWTLVTLAVLMILTGRLVPRVFYRALEQERDHWRAAAERNATTAESLLPGARIASEVTRALGGATGVHPPEDPGPTS